MPALFLKILGMSAAAGVFILAVILLRAVFRKAPKGILCLLWALAALRLVLPFSIRSGISLVPPFLAPDAPAFTYSELAVIPDVPLLPADEKASLADLSAVETPADPHPAVILSAVWLCGAAVMLGYYEVSTLRLRRKLREAVPCKENAWFCDGIRSPFVLGFLKPRIYLFPEEDEERLSVILRHEKAHIKRLDHVWKTLGYFILALHWFNPLVWAGYILFCRDAELACDEAVIGNSSLEERKAYSEALLFCSELRRVYIACPPAFGETGVRERVKFVLGYKKPALRIVLLSLLACAAAAAVFLTVRTDPSSVFSEIIIKKNDGTHVKNITGGMSIEEVMDALKLEDEDVIILESTQSYAFPGRSYAQMQTKEAVYYSESLHLPVTKVFEFLDDELRSMTYVADSRGFHNDEFFDASMEFIDNFVRKSGASPVENGQGFEYHIYGTKERSDFDSAGAGYHVQFLHGGALAEIGLGSQELPLVDGPEPTVSLFFGINIKLSDPIIVR